VKTFALLIAILMAAPALARTELPEGAIALSTVRRGRIVSVERGRSSTRVELELSVGGCANDLGPITHTIKKARMRTTLAVTAIDIVTKASSLVRCAPSGLLRSTAIEIVGRYTMRQLRLELLTDANGP
jgi:hypothetical protein